MPKIRKKTSSRTTTHKREKIKHKVAEGRRKAKKQAKKSTQWKSKHKKDPGIPNSFPFKDQILAEVAEQRRKVQEAKLQARVGKKKKGADEEEDEEIALPEINVTRAEGSAIKSQRAKDKSKAVAAEDDEEDVPPILVDPDYASLQLTLEKADVVLQVLDARDPLPYLSKGIDDFLVERKKGKSFLVLNKIDTCPSETSQAWASHLRKTQPTFLFRSSSACLPESRVTTKDTPKRALDDGLGVKALLTALKAEADKKSGEELIVAVVGIANVGKSSLVNSLCKARASAIYKPSPSFQGASTTKCAIPVLLKVNGTQLKFIDTPAIAFEDSKFSALDLLLRNQGRIDRVKDPVAAVTHVVSRCIASDLMLLYNLPAFPNGDVPAFLASMARTNRMIKSNGDPDTQNAARIVLRDWASGKFARYTSPPSSSSTNTNTHNNNPSDPSSDSPSSRAEDMKDIYAMDQSILSGEGMRTKREMRKGGNGREGVVRMEAGEVEGRGVLFGGEWVARGAEEEEGDGDGDDDNEWEDEDEEEDEEEEGEFGGIEDASDDDEDSEDSDIPAPAPAPSATQTKGKRKRKQQDEDEDEDELEDEAPTPAKRVTFGAPPKGSKEARTLGSRAKKSKNSEKSDTTATAAAKAKPSKTTTVVKPKTTKTTKTTTKAPTKAPMKVANSKGASVGKKSSSTPAASTKDSEDGEKPYDFNAFFK